MSEPQPSQLRPIAAIFFVLSMLIAIFGQSGKALGMAIIWGLLALFPPDAKKKEDNPF
jgi:hypothetical protein